MEEQKKPTNIIKRVTQEKIKRLLEDNSSWSRTMLAKLRRGIGKQPGELQELDEVFLGGMPEELFGKDGNPSYAEWAVYTALTLFALHQQGKEKDHPMNDTGNPEKKEYGNSLGAAVGYLARENKGRESAIKRRFDAVATANDFTELAYHARGLIQLLKAENISLDYPRFAMDLYSYQFDDTRNSIRLRWGEDYYRVVNKNKEGEEDNE